MAWDGDFSSRRPGLHRVWGTEAASAAEGPYYHEHRRPDERGPGSSDLRREGLRFTRTMRGAGWTQRQEGALSNAGWRGLRIILAGLVILSQLSGPWPASAQASSPNEYSVKAVFLFHFAQFVEWPEGTFPNATSPVVYCTIGEAPFQGALDVSLTGKTIDARALQVRHLKDGSEAQGCHVAFIGKTGKKRVTDEPASLGSSPVLTVGESEQFVKDNGMIAFCVEENKIRFNINLKAAEKVNLKISSRLLTLAKTVIGSPRR
jgi:uncharacterized protein DUF4154